MNKLSLNAKILSVLFVFVAGCLIVSVSGIMKVVKINSNVEFIIAGPAKRLELARTLQYLAAELENQQKKLILEENLEEAKKIVEVIHSQSDRAKEVISKLELIKIPKNAEHVELLAGIFSEWLAANQKIEDHSLAGRSKDANLLVRTEAQHIIDRLEEPLSHIAKIAESGMQEVGAKSDALVFETELILVGTTVICLFAGMLLAWYVMRSVNRAIDQVITSLDESSTQVASASQQIASTSQQLSQATTEQATSLEETAASVEEMNSMIAKNSENAQKTSETAKESQNTAKKGQETVALMIRSIGEINESNTNIMKQISDSNQQVSEIVHVISAIGNKTKVINDIVFQTKLLSFNASVEAARAGEHGKGFAVVAEEVGNLAEMSGNAAKEISAMLEGSIRKVEGIVQETKTSVERLISDGKQKVDVGTRVANECGMVLADIVQNISSVTGMSAEISSASQEQAQGIGEITKAMAQLDQVTQQNSATSEEAASAAEELSAQAENLKAGVLVLIDTIRGHNKPAKVRAKPVAHAAPKAKVKASTSKKVIHLKKSRTVTSNQPAHPAVALKKAVGHDSTPDYDDDRFTDV